MRDSELDVWDGQEGREVKEVFVCYRQWTHVHSVDCVDGSGNGSPQDRRLEE